MDARRFFTQFRCPDLIALAVAVAVKSLAKLHQNTLLQPSPGLWVLTDKTYFLCPLSRSNDWHACQA